MFGTRQVQRKRTMADFSEGVTPNHSVLHFKEEAVDVMEDCGKVNLFVLRNGPADEEVCLACDAAACRAQCIAMACGVLPSSTAHSTL